MKSLPQSYRELATEQGPSGALQYWVSCQDQDTTWDGFLEGIPEGHYQQSSGWAAYKAGEGWKCHRVVCTQADTVVGGFQCLWKRRGPFRIGYVLKGPVTHDASDSRLRSLGALLRQESHRLGLAALVVQAPDAVPPESKALQSVGFLQSNPFQVIQATCLIRTDDGMNAIVRRMNSTSRNNLNRARSRGVIIRVGSESDLPRFFELMLGSCARQNTRPNPGSLAAFHHLWSSFSRQQAIRVTFAECQGETTAAALCIAFGNRLSLWKKGWDSRFKDWFPNSMLYADLFEWASRNGFHAVDHCAFDLQAAVLARKSGSMEGISVQDRDLFILRHGGVPQLLPPALIHLSNPVLRFLYRRFRMPREKSHYPRFPC